jgi:hypothetical protein
LQGRDPNIYYGGIFRLSRKVIMPFIALIPKKLGASRFKDFHPISLVSRVYKIIVKFLPIE